MWSILKIDVQMINILLCHALLDELGELVLSANGVEDANYKAFKVKPAGA
jgi:hypothetical protein